MRPIGWLVAGALAANAQGIPSTYQDLYSSLQDKLTAFDAILAAGWDGSKPPMEFRAEILSANSDRGLALLGPNGPAGAELEIRSLQALGVTTVSLAIDFPVLYKPFYAYNGDPNDYQKMLAYYRQVAASARAHGLRLAVHTGPADTGDLPAGSGWNLAGYYKTLNLPTYIAARGDQVLTIAQQIQPDSLALAGEPDQEAALTGQASLGTAAGFSAMVDAFLSKLNQAGYTGTYAGAGVGSWLAGASDYLAALAAKPRLNFLTVEMRAINGSLLEAGAALLDQAAASGKPVALLSGWLEKRDDAEFPASDIGRDPDIEARSPFRFWAALDQQFLREMVELGWWKHAAAVSVFHSDYFRAYLTYSRAYDDMSYGQIMARLNASASAARQADSITSTGAAWQALTAPSDAKPALISAAAWRAGAVAPGSIVSIYGSNLASTTATASMPLPTTLSGVSLTFFDDEGDALPAALYFVSPGQVNAIVPADLPAGEATFAIAGQRGMATVTGIAPGLFSASSNGRGPANAYVSRLKPDGTNTSEPAFACGTAGACANVPIDVSPSSGKATLQLFGTGIRGRGDLADVEVSVGGVLAEVTYAGAHPQTPGMDLVSVTLPASLAGRGEVNVALRIGGQWANVVTVFVK